MGPPASRAYDGAGGASEGPGGTTLRVHCLGLGTDTPWIAGLIALLTAADRIVGYAGRETKQALSKHPEQETLAVVLGDVLRRQRRPEDALGAYARAARANSVTELPRRWLAETHVELLPRRLGEFRELLADLEHRSTPGSSRAIA